MWIVRLALRRPYTFVVAAMLVAILGVLTIFTMPVDIFPRIDIPVIAVAFNYSGMSPDEMETRIISNYEKILTVTVGNIEHIESQSLHGVAVVKVFFYQGSNMASAMAQVSAISQTAIRQMPPGTQPPLIIEYNASNVPVIQLAMGSDRTPEQDMFDISNTIVRPAMSTVQGAQMPWPYGGKQKQIMVDLDPEKLFAWGISPLQVSSALGNQNLILPAGNVKIGKQDMEVRINSSPTDVKQLNDLPIKTIKGIPVFIGDIGHVRDGFTPQQSLVHSDGKRGVLLVILKAGDASTLEVVDRVKAALPAITSQIPANKQVNIGTLFDQSVFVRASVEGVVREAGIAAGLTALMILIFLGSWRSTLIVCISIPLSILVSIIILHWLGETLNVMTLGGMALAVGILVDDATVEIENIHRNLHQRKRLVQAILDGASQIAIPAFVSTLCICIVFVPVVFISGSARSLFTPLAMAVVFAMLTSYLLSRTLVPTMVHYLLASEVELYGGKIDPTDPHAHPEYAHAHDPRAKHVHVSILHCLLWAIVWVGSAIVALAILGAIALAIPVVQHAIGVSGYVPALQKLRPYSLTALVWIDAMFIGAVLLRYIMANYYIWRFHEAFNRQFEKLRRFYGGFLQLALRHRGMVATAFGIFVIASCGLYLFVGRDFFPTVDAGQIRMHVRLRPGTRLEQSEIVFGRIEDSIRKIIPKEDITTILDNIGIPNSSINLSLSDGSLMSSADGEILISLKPDHKTATAVYMNRMRDELHKQFPEETFFFMPADIVTQVLNFGIPAPIDIQIAGPLPNNARNYQIANAIKRDLSVQRGAADVHIFQVPHAPDLRVTVDRTLASEVGVTQQEVASDMLVSLSGTAQQNPNWFINPHSGFQYSVLVETPQYKITSINDLQNQPVVIGASAAGGGTAGTDQDASSRSQLLGNLSSLSHGYTAANVTHYKFVPTFDVQCSANGTDLGSVSNEVDKIVAKYQKELPRGSSITVRGQVQSMKASFTGLAYGIIFAILLVYLLMVINFQSWLDPLIILMALPGALAGIAWMLYATQTSVSVPTLMGAIMSIGVATANSILMITFANDQRKIGMNAHDAALSAGLTRLRPVIMTALAMIIGMLPMAFGMGEGGEQNAPLGRAVIGGLLFATFATLFFVPVVYSALRTKAPVTQVEKELQA